MGDDLYIGLMSGTSLDGVDGVIYDLSSLPPHVVAHANAPMPHTLRNELLALNAASENELHRAALAANALVHVYATVVNQLLHQANLNARHIQAIGAHGQTVRHRPAEFDGTGYTIQLNNPALLAELTGIDVVADFRSRDVAAGGQGAPLVPAFHQAIFATQAPNAVVLNMGGISNLSVLGASDQAEPMLGFDCGPGNALMDHWCHTHTGQSFDADGAWAASGQVNNEVLRKLMSEPFIEALPPKSTGRDLFNPAWLAQQLKGYETLAPNDVQATLTEFTAQTCASNVRHFAKPCKTLIVCGGGALNGHLMRNLQAALPEINVSRSDAYGLSPLQVEAAAFAWLARKMLRRETASFKNVTGAQGPRILGALYPA
ncbi:MAG TPA: anhydro-N-acetylmuramic acid kinase [Burkholderiaceae bacterium]|nr:anhydro-N-acetylmuramic acid kinase [Burkholderiaceae bacterium]